MPRKRPTEWRATHRAEIWYRDATEPVSQDFAQAGDALISESGVRQFWRAANDEDWSYDGRRSVARFTIAARPGVKPRAGVKASKRITVNLTPERMALVEAAAKREGLSLSQWAEGAIDLALARGSTR